MESRKRLVTLRRPWAVMSTAMGTYCKLLESSVGRADRNVTWGSVFITPAGRKALEAAKKG